MFVVELTIGFESNIAKRNKYKNLTRSLKSSYDQVKYVNLSLGACGIIGKGSEPFFDLLRLLQHAVMELHQTDTFFVYTKKLMEMQAKM